MRLMIGRSPRSWLLSGHWQHNLATLLHDKGTKPVTNRDRSWRQLLKLEATAFIRGNTVLNKRIASYQTGRDVKQMGTIQRR
jgi:hypothetical protein